METGEKRGAPDIARGRELLRKYREGKASLERRIVENEEWWRLRHWKHVPRKGPQEALEPASAWLFNCLLNKHADAMDNYPEPVVLPREEADAREAELLTRVLPALLERCEYEQTYSDMWWYKLKMGTGVQGVFWNPTCHGGLGDVEIRRVDLLNLYWEPGTREIQQSRNVFHVEYVDRDALIARYPRHRAALQSAPEEIARYAGDDPVDLSGKIAVVDWYYKKTDAVGREALHYCKFAGEATLYASERDPSLRGAGFYAHGKYPFVFDTLFTREDAPVGFGYLDVMKDAQTCIDRLNALLLNHALMAGRKRFFVRLDGGVNEQEFADWGRDFVHVAGSLSEESIREIKLSGMDAACLQMLSAKVDELKETSGNRDFSQGGTAAGVTAASAIAALQEAGSKLSRDMVKGGYRAFTQVCTLVIELMRQFYTEPRAFRIAGETGGTAFVAFGGGEDGSADGAVGADASFDSLRGNTSSAHSGIANTDADLSPAAFRETPRVPAYDIRIRSQRANPFSTLSQNETAKELFRMGFFRRENAESALMCLKMMRFEGVQELRAELERMLAEDQAGALPDDALPDGALFASPRFAADGTAGMPDAGAAFNQLDLLLLADALARLDSGSAGIPEGGGQWAR